MGHLMGVIKLQCGHMRNPESFDQMYWRDSERMIYIFFFSDEQVHLVQNMCRNCITENLIAFYLYLSACRHKICGVKVLYDLSNNQIITATTTLLLMVTGYTRPLVGTYSD